VKPYLPLLRGKNIKALGWKWRCWLSKTTVNKQLCKSLLVCPRSLRLWLLFTQKRSMTQNCGNISTGEPTKSVTVKFLKTHRACVKLHISFFLFVFSSSIQNIQFPKNQTHYTCLAVVRTTAVKICTREHNTWSKTTQMIETTWITICVFVIFSDC